MCPVAFVWCIFLKRNSSLGFIFITLLIDALGISLLIPILPEFIAHLGNHTLSESAQDYGRLMALYGAMQFLFAPTLGMLSDRYGRRPVLLLSLLCAALDYVMMALAPSLIFLYIGRMISGLTGANFTAASAYIADVSPPEKRAQNFGLIGAAFGIGFVIGPAIGGILGDMMGPRFPFWVAAGLCFANFLYGWFILPESHKVENRRTSLTWREANPIGVLRVLGKYPVVWGLTGALVATHLAMYCINSTWVLFTQVRFDWNPKQVGFSLAAFGAMALIYQLGLARFIFPALGERKVMVIGMTVAAIEFVAYAFATQGWMIYLIMIVGGIGMLGGQAAQGLLSRQVNEHEQGALQGGLTSLMSLTGIFGPVISTGLFSYFTSDATALYLPGVSFLLAALLNMIALAITLRVLLRLRDKTDAVQTAIS